MLHLVKNAQALNEMIAYYQADDAVLLMEDAVYTTRLCAQEIDHLSQFNMPIYILESDLLARGLPTLYKSYRVIDYRGFVTLTEQHQQSICWE